MDRKQYRLGIDIGSTTVKIAILDEKNEVLFSDYQRHFANIQETLARLLIAAKEKLGELDLIPMITGSGGLTLATHLHVSFVQEVVAVATALKAIAPKTDVAIELGGEDAKIIYFTGGIDQRMNGICAGGTGSFIDQMASLLQTDASGLNDYAKSYKAIYPIAARCGVFAKSDIQPLINEGATREDLAASIFQAVVNQTISGLACGKPIRGHVAFLGGPLHFLPELKNAFIRTLRLTDEYIIDPDNSHLFAAIGSAMSAEQEESVDINDLIERLKKGVSMDHEVQRLEPLFRNEEEFREFEARHTGHSVKSGDFESYEGKIFLGIDAGSTTTKMALIGEEGQLLYKFYSGNEGSPLTTAIRAIEEIQKRMHPNAEIVYSCSTGYGEALLKAAFQLDEGEVETISHYYAAAFFEPEVDCILDIGGQDMKCIRIKDHTVDSVQLNEACSAGCGSFIETFAKSLGYSVQDFAKEALFAKNPVDLGTRCTVFMNSNVKQAQKEGATVADISAGLAYSVIKNALFKVIKIADASSLGQHIVVQGGTFYNDAVLRAFERTAECQCVRPDIAGIMGAFGAALIARERWENQTTTMLPLDKIIALQYKTAMTRCQGCNNKCVLTVNQFGGGRRFISGNRCERGLGLDRKKKEVPNVFDYKMHRLFDIETLSEDEAPRGTIGIPRVLNLYENYPFWAVFFRALGFRVVLSPVSTRKIYELGIESIPSESECYPAKITHGHVSWLIRNGIKTIFYPCIPYERNEENGATNHYNCPIVTSYAENIKNNVEEIETENIRFLSPFMAFTNEKILSTQLEKIMQQEFGIPAAETRAATHAGWAELLQVQKDVEAEGERAVQWCIDNKKHGIVLAGRPYHLDPEIHHGIPDMIAGFGLAVLTEDCISHLGKVERPVVVSDQWMYHSRLYAAASYVKNSEVLDLVQLNSFGCGLDAVTTDQVSDILTGSDKIYTVLKIDEVNNLGAARIRIRSLIAALRVRDRKHYQRTVKSAAYDRVLFTKQMKKDNYTILCPQMSPIHFDLLAPAISAFGYNVVLLDNDDRRAVDMGLKYVNNDACFPSLCTIGQVMDALLSGEYDLNHTAIFMSQTGGGCRASNYIGFIRRALEKAGMGHIPVISVNVGNMEQNPGFKVTIPMAIKAIQATVYGDVMMRCLYATRPYEMVPGSAEQLHKKWRAICTKAVSKRNPAMSEYRRIVRAIVKDFDELPRRPVKKPRVGVVGEILVKFSPLANNHIVDLLEREGAEAVMPDLLDFMYYSFYNLNFKAEHLGFSKKGAFLCNVGIKLMDWFRADAKAALRRSKHFTEPGDIRHMAEMSSKFVSLGNMTGEGWFLTGEMLELIESGVKNIVCTQPFGCLPNHVVGKGVIKQLRASYPDANIIAVDYDPGASEVNQLNRIKLMLAMAQKDLRGESCALPEENEAQGSCGCGCGSHGGAHSHGGGSCGCSHCG